MNSNRRGWELDRATAERLATELGWRIGQAADGQKLLYRPGLPEPILCKTWLAMATYMIDYIERRRGGCAAAQPNTPARPMQKTTLGPAQVIPVAQHAPRLGHAASNGSGC